MDCTIEEAAARLPELAAAAARGERVVVTRHGAPFVELVPVRPAPGMDLDHADAVRRDLGLDGVTVIIPPEFDDPAYSRRVLGLEP